MPGIQVVHILALLFVVSCSCSGKGNLKFSMGGNAIGQQTNYSFVSPLTLGPEGHSNLDRKIDYDDDNYVVLSSEQVLNGFTDSGFQSSYVEEMVFDSTNNLLYISQYYDGNYSVSVLDTKGTDAVSDDEVIGEIDDAICPSLSTTPIYDLHYA